MTHLTEGQLARISDGSLDATPAMTAHLAACAACREAIDAQTLARRVLAARPIEPVRDLSAAIRATLDAERPWIERLNWRRLSLRMAPVAAALTIAAMIAVKAADSSARQSADAAAASDSAASNHTVASALYSGEVDDDQLLTLILSARPDDALSTYVTKEK